MWQRQETFLQLSRYNLKSRKTGLTESGDERECREGGDILRLYRSEKYAEPLKVWCVLADQACCKNSAHEWTLHVAELKKPLTAEGEQTVLPRVRPNTVISRRIEHRS